MKIRKTLMGLTIGVVSIISVSDIWNIHQVKAESLIDTNFEQALCSKFVSGTYLTTISDSTGKFTSRSVITLTSDGNIFVIDSNQGGVLGAFNPFTSSQGAWNCNRNGKITATALNFSLSGTEKAPLGIAGQNYSATFNQRTQTLQGIIELRFFDLNATVQKATGSSGVPLTFTFTGQRVNAK